MKLHADTVEICFVTFKIRAVRNENCAAHMTKCQDADEKFHVEDKKSGVEALKPGVLRCVQNDGDSNLLLQQNKPGVQCCIQV